MEAQNLDAIVYPTIAQLPVQIGDPQTGSHCSLSANSGLPALSMPVGFTDSDLPVGLELLGRELADAELLAMAYAFEQANNPRRTPLVTPALENGVAPAGETLFVSVNESGIAVEAVFEYRPTTNELFYTIVHDTNAANELHAATLVMTAEKAETQAGVTVQNLLAPGVRSASGSYYMSAQFREAFTEGRVGVRLFAESLPAGGLIQALR